MTNNDIYIEARKRYPHRWAGDVENDNNLEVFCEGAEWAQEQIITRTCHALDKVLSQQMLAELVKVMKGE